METSSTQKQNNEESVIDGINESGSAKAERISDASTARDLYLKLRDEDSIASSFRVKIQGQLDGNPPRDPVKMRDLGLGGFSNVNWREGEAIVDLNGSSFWELDMEVPTFISVSVRDDRGLAVPDEVDYGGIIAAEYTRTLREWPEYFYNRMLSILEMLRYGHGPVYWRDKWDWRFEATKVGSVLFPSDTKSLIKEPEMVMIRDTMQVGQLYALIETDKDKSESEDEGWDAAEVKDAILRAQKNRLSPEKRIQVPEWEALQQLIKNNDYAANHVTCNPVGVVHILIREISGKKGVTHYIIPEDEARTHFMFRKQNEFESMYHVICPFLSGVGDGYIKSVKGLGHKIYPHIEQSNRYINHIVNTGYLAGSLLITSDNPNALSLTQFGPVTMLPKHVNPLAQNFMPNMQSISGVRDLILGVVNNNTGTFTRQSDNQSGPPKTAREISVKEIKNARLEKTQVNIHYLQLDALHREIFRRLVNKDYPEYADGYEQAQKFRQRCIDRGVPAEFMNYDNCYLSAMRAVGQGSAVAQNDITTELLSISDRFPVIGQNNALRDFVAARVGHSMVDRYVPVVTMRDVPNSESSVAALENNAIVMGMDTLVGADQPHAIHVPVHMNLLGSIIQAFMQASESGQADVVKSYGILMRGMRHVGEHMQYWTKDSSRKGEKKKVEESLKQVEQFVKRMEPQVRAAQDQQRQQMQQAQQAQQQQMSPDMQVALRKIEEDTAVKRENMLRQNQIREEKADHSMRLAEAKTAANIAREGAMRQ
jgi:hypothetical protein